MHGRSELSRVLFNLDIHGRVECRCGVPSRDDPTFHFSDQGQQELNESMC
jgi:hypothetical protein